MIPAIVRVGTVLTGYCNGYFGRDSYGEKRVEALGADWVVAREFDGTVVFARCPPETMESHIVGAAADDQRSATCIEVWPECHDDGYDPRCCRFPKACSPVR